MLLSLLGVDQKTIVADYLRSNTRQANTDRWLKALSERGGLQWEDVAPMTRVRAEYLQTAFTNVDRTYGSFDEYVSSALKLSSTDGALGQIPSTRCPGCGGIHSRW